MQQNSNFFVLQQYLHIIAGCRAILRTIKVVAILEGTSLNLTALRVFIKYLSETHRIADLKFKLLYTFSYIVHNSWSFMVKTSCALIKPKEYALDCSPKNRPTFGSSKHDSDARMLGHNDDAKISEFSGR
jgi:hypothetical protein